jgi:uncharacterized protein (TIGR03000 family)
MPPAKPEDTTPPKKDEARAAPDRARLIVSLPTDAKLFIDDQLMKSTSDKRTFNTPVLDKDQTYYYILRVEALNDGKPVSETRRVLVRAGGVIRADFTSMAESEAAAIAR